MTQKKYEGRSMIYVFCRPQIRVPFSRWEPCYILPGDHPITRVKAAEILRANRKFGYWSSVGATRTVMSRIRNRKVR